MSYRSMPSLEGRQPRRDVHLLLDVGAVKTGGGVQLALNFLDPFFNAVVAKGWHVSLLLPSSGLLANYRHPACVSFLTTPNNPLKRLWFEHIKLGRWMQRQKINVAFTFFGFGLPKKTGVFSLVSMANATTCYPESHYWQYIPVLPRIKKMLYNGLRLKRLRQADYLILETKVMFDRINSLLQRSPSLGCVAGPSPSTFIPELPPRQYYGGSLKILVLSGLDFHKNLWRLPQICKFLKLEKSRAITFVASFDRQAFVHAYGLDLCRQDFDEFIEFRGPIPQPEIASAYQECDILLSLSDLESFSNNYMEAWKSGMAQVCSDRDFARYICQDSAIYLEPHDPKAVAALLISLTHQPEKLHQCALEGKKQLAALPTLEKRVATIIDIIESATENVPLCSLDTKANTSAAKTCR